MKRTVFSLLTAFALCVSAAAAGPAVSCPSALLMEKQTGTVLFAQDEHTPREPASVTKIMTLLLVMEAIDSGALSYNDVVTGSAHAAGMGGSQIWLKENEQMTQEELHEYIVTHIAKHKTPRYIRFVDAFPMNAAGKILKYKMREEAVELLGLQADNSIITA